MNSTIKTLTTEQFDSRILRTQPEARIPFTDPNSGNESVILTIRTTSGAMDGLLEVEAWMKGENSYMLVTQVSSNG